MEPVTSEDIRTLLEAFASSSFRPKDCESSAVVVQDKCTQLFTRDFPDSILVQNQNGELSTSYPLSIIIPRKKDESVVNTSANEVSSSKSKSNPICDGDMDCLKIRDLMMKARVARCRARFPVPVILFDGKYVCRSATLSGGPEIYGRSGFDLLFPSANDEEEVQDCLTNQPSLPTLSSLSLSDSSQIFSKVRAQDINLLKHMGVKFIGDLMVEKKKVKFGVYITSSEKADKEGRYNDFEILSLPYPGCEFFKEYRDKGYAGEGLVFDWKQNFVDAILDIPVDPISKTIDIDWKEYKSWDILTLTKNYIKLFLRYLICSDSSLLVHCISGWDRTPLFVSLLRLTLWADGKIHQSLSAVEMTFLTLAYDWYLFGHNLNDRISKGEEILFFCFYFLQFLATDDFSVDSIQEDISRPLRKTSQNHSHQSLSGAMDSLEMQSEDVVDGHACYLGSCTSLNSNSSSASLRSQESAPHVMFDTSFCCVKKTGIDSYPNTPPTLTNSEDCPCFLEDDSSGHDSCKHDKENRLDEIKRSPSLKVGAKSGPMPIPVSMDRRKSLKFEESWQFVSETGSIKDSPRGGLPPFNSPDSQDSLSSVHSRKNASLHTNAENSPRVGRSIPRRASRKERLQAVRALFYQNYYTVIGPKLKNGNESKNNSSSSLSLLYHLGGYTAGRVTAQH